MTIRRFFLALVGTASVSVAVVSMLVIVHNWWKNCERLQAARAIRESGGLVWTRSAERAWRHRLDADDQHDWFASKSRFWGLSEGEVKGIKFQDNKPVHFEHVFVDICRLCPEDLCFVRVHLSCADLRQITSLRSVSRLRLVDNGLGNEHILALSGMRQLRYLYLQENGVSYDAVNQLEQQLPDCRIQFYSGAENGGE